MKRSKLARTALAVAPYALVALSIALYTASVWARPGGGQSFGGRGGGGGGGGGSGDCGAVLEILWFLIELTVEHPAIGIPLDIVIVLAIVVGAVLKNKKQEEGWTTAAAQTAQRALIPSRQLRKRLLATASRTDPDFSIVLFEDFVYALFATVHEARGKGQLEPLAAYVRPEARAKLTMRSGFGAVETPVIGALRYRDLVDLGAITVTLDFEANYTEVHGGRSQTFYVVERWTLTRAAGARSRPPEKATIIGCPNCGAPLSNLRGNRCTYCQQIVDTGQLDWMVDSIEELDRMERPPQLTSDTEERGTSLPTVVDPDAGARLHMLTRKDPAFAWPRFLNRVALIHAELQPAWTTRNAARMRPFVSDQLFQMLAYWLESYKRAGLRNVTEDVRITGIELAAMLSDRHYDAITVRLRATGLDYTMDMSGRVLSGSRSRPRPYTEYWTFIRGTRATTRGTPDKACPNCGAPFTTDTINMAGNCTHCNAKITSGEFDWVLSRIEQDEAYTG